MSQQLRTLVATHRSLHCKWKTEAGASNHTVNNECYKTFPCIIICTLMHTLGAWQTGKLESIRLLISRLGSCLMGSLMPETNVSYMRQLFVQLYQLGHHLFNCFTWPITINLGKCKQMKLVAFKDENMAMLTVHRPAIFRLCLLMKYGRLKICRLKTELQKQFYSTYTLGEVFS